VPNILVAEGVSRWFFDGPERVAAVREVNVRIGQGELVAMLGPSGAGKSTLLAICGGLDMPDQGRVTVAGQDVSSLDSVGREKFLQRTVGWIFQDAGLLPLLTAEENVALAARIAGMPKQEARAAALTTLEAVGLGDRAEHRGNELSGGELQRAALARALVKNPVLVIADEPTGQLDGHTGGAVMQLIRDAADYGIAVLLATHDPAVAELADRVLMMNDGYVREAARAV